MVGSVYPHAISCPYCTGVHIYWRENVQQIVSFYPNPHPPLTHTLTHAHTPPHIQGTSFLPPFCHTWAMAQTIRLKMRWSSSTSWRWVDVQSKTPGGLCFVSCNIMVQVYQVSLLCRMEWGWVVGWANRDSVRANVIVNLGGGIMSLLRNAAGRR